MQAMKPMGESEMLKDKEPKKKARPKPCPAPQDGISIFDGADTQEHKDVVQEGADGAQEGVGEDKGNCMQEGVGEQGRLAVGCEVDLDALALVGGLRREIVNRALDDSTQKRGADWMVVRGRIAMTPECAKAILKGVGHGVSKEALEQAKKAKGDYNWNGKSWRRMWVLNPACARRIILGYLMDSGEGVRCIVPDNGRFIIGMHVVVRRSALVSQPDLYELAEEQPRKKGRW